jgi:hypothetical protein
MLGDGGNNGNMDLRIAGIPKRVKSPSPWSDHTSYGQQNQTSQRHEEYGDSKSYDQSFELPAWYTCTDEVDEAYKLEKPKNS